MLGPLSSTFCTGCSAAAPLSSFSAIPPPSPGPSRITAQDPASPPSPEPHSISVLHHLPSFPIVFPTSLRQACLGPTPLPVGLRSPRHHLHASHLLPTLEPSSQGKSSQVMFGKITNASRCQTPELSLALSPCRPCPAAAPAPSFQQAPSTGIDLPAQPVGSSHQLTLPPELRPQGPAPYHVPRPPRRFPHSDWSLPAAPGASLTLGTLTTNVLQERKPSFPDLVPYDLQPGFLKGSGARQVGEDRGHHSPGGFFNWLPFYRDRPSGTRSPPRRLLRQLPQPRKSRSDAGFLRSPCDFFFFNLGSLRQQNKEDRHPLRTYCFFVSSNLCSFLRRPPDLKPWQCAAGAPMVTMS